MGIVGSTVESLVRILPARFTDRVFRSVTALQSNDQKLSNGVLTLWGCVENLKRNGFAPGAIIDVGAHVGAWTRRVHAIFPDAPILMLEASPDKDAPLAAVKRELGDSVDYRIALLAATSGRQVPFHIVRTPSGSGTGSSVLRERTAFAQEEVVMSTTRLDDVPLSPTLAPPYFLKLDVQGYELEVLRGGSRVLAGTEVVMMEVSLTEYNEGAPLAAEVIATMSQLGFALFDVCSQTRRPDRTLFQLDLMFVRLGSRLLEAKPFWKHEG